jgi:hypothetical protein
MTPAWLPHAILRAASLLVPSDQRAGWLEEWHSELWYVPGDGAARFCLGAFRDGLWLRRNSHAPATPSLLQSPIHMLALLASIAALSLWIAMLVSGPHMRTPDRLMFHGWRANYLFMLFLSCFVLGPTRLAMGRPPEHPHPLPWPGRIGHRICRGLFLLLKFLLLQPVLLCGFALLARWGNLVPGSPFVFFASWILAFRWMLLDQRRRCPVCLRTLTDPVRIGSPSQTFLDWYGGESMCSRGHGLLQVSEISNSCSGNEWLNLDPSWSGLFPTR